jgi:7-carboxy-7-deazaguanine synthase
MSKFHYSEKFYSVQAEARYTGVPSVFLRMFGCNFRCRNFGRYQEHILGDDVTHNPEVVEIIRNLDQYQTFKDLPLVETGCDSYSSIYPEFKKFVIKETADELAQGIVDLLPYRTWRDEHLVITGGEPLLGWQRSYPELLNHELMRGLSEITFETNGTQPLTPEFKESLNEWLRWYVTGPKEITFSVSPKLSVSGERAEDAIKPRIVADYESVGYTYLKFVVTGMNDIAEIEHTVHQYRDEGFTGPIYLMPVGGVDTVYYEHNKKVAEVAMKLGYRYSARLQIDLFSNAWGT